MTGPQSAAIKEMVENAKVDPEAPTPKTKLPWLVKSATFDQLSLTLALLEEQGYTPTLLSPGGMIPDTRPGGGLMWCGSAYTVCGKRAGQPINEDMHWGQPIHIGIDPASGSSQTVRHEKAPLVECPECGGYGQVPIGPINEMQSKLCPKCGGSGNAPNKKAGPSLPVQPKGKGKK